MSLKHTLPQLSCLLIFLGSALHAHAQKIVYVNDDATGANDGTSWTNAYTNFQDGVNNADVGDEVWVAGGTYQPAYQQSFSMKEGVEIYGGFAGSETNLDQRNLGAGPASVLQGNGARVFTHTNNGLTDAAVLDGFTITGGNSGGSLGGGMYNNAVSPTIINCIFSGNRGEGAGGMYNDNSYPTIINCIFWKNDGGRNGGGGMKNYYSPATIINCTFAGNILPNVIGSGLVNVASPVIIVNSAMTDGIYDEGNTSAENVTYSLVQNLRANGPDLDDTNLPSDTDPQFEDAENGDFRLKSTSPLINRGNTDVGNLPAKDLTGNARVQQDGVDIGAYESAYLPVPLPSVDGIVYIKPGGDGNLTGSSWDNATGDFQAAIDGAAAGAQVWVAAGEYKPAIDASFTMKEGVTIFGGFAGTETSLAERDLAADYISKLSGNGASVISNNHNGLTREAVLDGFTIAGGDGSNGGGMINYSASPTIANCTFSDNSALYGGGMYNDNSFPEVSNCHFVRNSAVGEGGGMYNSSASPTITDCTFSDNTAQYGSGMENSYSSPEMSNCTFNENRATVFGGGIYNYHGSPKIADCTFSRNGAADGAGMYDNQSASTVKNCIFLDNTASAGGGAMFNNSSASYPTIINSNFFRNSASEGGGIHNVDSSPTITNCTFSRNSADLGAAVYNITKSSPAITNSIMYDNNGGGVYNADVDSNPAVNFSLVQGISDDVGEGNFADGTNPQFVNADDGDFRIKHTSPLIDAGDNDAISGVDTDLAGNARIHYEVVDLGAYENLNNAPVLAAGTGATEITYTENAAPLVVDADFTLTDDNDELPTAILTFVSGNDKAQDMLVFENTDPSRFGNITASFDEESGTLTLAPSSGSATIAQWQSALRAVTYANSSDNPTVADRVLNITVSDGGRASTPLKMTIKVIAVNDPPEITSRHEDVIVEENTANVTTFTATDLEDVALIFSLSGGADKDLFTVSEITGDLSFSSAPDADDSRDANNDNIYEVAVSVTDNGGETDTQKILVTVTDVNDVVPVITANQSFELNENNPVGTVVGTVVATDGDITPTTFRDWTITSGNEANTFAVDASTGEITVASDIDTETMIGYTLMLTVSDGVNTSAVENITIVRSHSAELKIPTAFTPNHDGVNDTWEIGNIAQHPNAVIHVFNRDGREVFSSTGYTNPWDGTWNGKALSFGIYYFIVNLNDAAQRTYKGTVMIL